MPTSPHRASRQHAVAELYASYFATLTRNVAASVHGPEAMIEDACQDAWAISMRRPDVDPTDPRTRGWLKVIATRRAYDAATASRRDSDEATRVATASPAAVDPTDELNSRIDDTIVLSQLKPADAQALLLQAAGYSYREIAQLTDSTYTAVNRRLTEGRARLRALQP